MLIYSNVFYNTSILSGFRRKYLKLIYSLVLIQKIEKS